MNRGHSTEEIIEQFLEYMLAERRASPLTVDNYRRDILRFKSWYDESHKIKLDFKSLGRDDIREWILFRAEGDAEGNKIKPASLNREFSSLRSLCKYLRSRSIISQELFLGISQLKSSKRLPDFVPKSRMLSILQSYEQEGDNDFESLRNHLIIEMFYSMGLRLAELIGINRNDIDGDFSSLRVVGKGNKQRKIPITEPTRNLLIKYISEIDRQNICEKEENALFLTLKGKRISRSTLYRIVKRELSKGNVQGKRSPHVLRHTFATMLLNNGADMREIQELLGHSSLKATEVYTHNDIEELKKVYSTAHPRERL